MQQHNMTNTSNTVKLIQSKDMLLIIKVRDVVTKKKRE
jgi:hypothetical protein